VVTTPERWLELARRSAYVGTMNLRLPRRKRVEPLPEVEEREAHKFERRYAEEQGTIRAIFKKMGRANLDNPFRRD
jgi:hypothetical protein